MMKHVALVALGLLVAAGGAAPAQRRPEGWKVARIDEAAHNPELARLRDGVLVAARERDLARLLPLLSDPVRVPRDSELMPMSHNEFATWFAGRSTSEQALFWQDLRDAFTLGMAYERAAEPMLLAPYTLVAINTIVEPTEKDAYQYYAITGSRVAVRRDPTLSSPIIQRLDHELIEKGPAVPAPMQPGALDGVYEWRQVKTRSGQLGWVASKYALNVFDRRFAVEKRDGVWKITALAKAE
jgi:hypothetical protein